MDLTELEDIVENMVLQLSYPGLDVRTLNIALPPPAYEAPTKVYLQALKSKNINVNLVALRWFQARSGAAKHHLPVIAELLRSQDSWIRKEAIKTVDCTKTSEPKLVLDICHLLKDEDQIVRQEAAKFLGRLSSKNSEEQKELRLKVISHLQQAAEDPVQEVRRKAIKALRKIGAFST